MRAKFAVHHAHACMASCQDQPVLRREKMQVDIAFDFFFFVAVWRDVRGK